MAETLPSNPGRLERHRFAGAEGLEVHSAQGDLVTFELELAQARNSPRPHKPQIEMLRRVLVPSPVAATASNYNRDIADTST